MRAVLKIAGITIKELLYERVFYLLAAFAVAAMALSILLGQLTYTEKSKLTIDLLLAGIQISTLLFSVFMGISLLHRELSLGWIALTLSKPISRAGFLLGKFLGQVLILGVVLTAISLVTFAVAIVAGITVTGPAFLQTISLIYAEGIILTAVAYFFAVNTSALLAGTASLFVFGLGHFVQSATGVNPALESNPMWEVVKAVVPNLEMLNTKGLASYGLTLDFHSYAIAWAYALVCTGLFLTAALLFFQRRDIYT